MLVNELTHVTLIQNIPLCDGVKIVPMILTSYGLWGFLGSENIFMKIIISKGNLVKGIKNEPYMVDRNSSSNTSLNESDVEKNS